VDSRLWVFAGAGAVLVGIFVAAIVCLQWGAHVELRGRIAKVRTAAADESSSIVVVDFRFVNPSDYPFIVRRVDVFVEDANGRVHEGAVISEADAKRLFEALPLLGQKYNESLVIRTRIRPKETMDRMVAARFELPEAGLLSRKRLWVRVEDVDGAVSQIAEAK
jgi:hypothetical protein